MKRPRLGSDPLSAPTGVNALIRDTRQSTHSKQSIHSTQRPPASRSGGVVTRVTARANTPSAKRRGPAAPRRGETPAADWGLPPGWTRATFIVRKDNLEKLRSRATFRKNIKTLLDEALRAHLRRGAK